MRQRLIDYRLGTALLVVTTPLAILGTVASGIISGVYLQAILGVGLVVAALSFLRQPRREDVVNLDTAIRRDYGGPQAETCLITAQGEEIRYTVCNRTEGRLLSGIGALFMGMVSTGLGEMNGYFLATCCLPCWASVSSPCRA